MTQRILRTQYDLDLWVKYLATRQFPQTVSAVDGADRSLEQNRLQFLWAREASEQRGDLTANEVREEWKLHHGVPILRAENIEFQEVYDEAIKPLPYHRKLKAMRFIPVTSEMNVRQMVAYLDCIERECAEQGLRLTAPDPDLAKYQSRYRDKKEAA